MSIYSITSIEHRVRRSGHNDKNIWHSYFIVLENGDSIEISPNLKPYGKKFERALKEVNPQVEFTHVDGENNDD